MSEETVISAAAPRRIGPGTRLNDLYEIDSLIATGGMGEVYKGHAIETGDEVAIKTIRPDLASSGPALALFRKEASALHNLYNEAIIRYYVFSIDKPLGLPYLAMEYVSGEALGDIASRGPLPFEAVDTLRRRLALGLQAAHDLGIVHRDVSPDNVILPAGNPARAKIIDFGIARSPLGGATVIGEGFAGKYGYVSPEQLGLFGADVTPKSDIYSLGLILAEAALGHRIDMGQNPVDVVEKRRRIPDLAGLDERLRPLLEAMLRPDPAARIGTMAEVAAWAPPAPRVAAAATHGSKPRSKRAPILAAAAIAVAALIGGTAYYVIQDVGSGQPMTEAGLDSARLEERMGSPLAAATPTLQAPVAPVSEPASNQPPPARHVEQPARPVSSPARLPATPMQAAPSNEPASSPDRADLSSRLSAALRSTPAPSPVREPAPSGPSQPMQRVDVPVPPAAPPASVPASPPARESAASRPPPKVDPPTLPAAPALSRPPPQTGQEPVAARPSAPAAQRAEAPTALAVVPPTDPAPAPQQQAALAPPTPIRPNPVEQVADYIRGYRGGDCFYLSPLTVAAREASIEAYGAAPSSFAAFDTAFTGAFGFDAQIQLRLINEAQCPVVDLLARQAVQRRAKVPKLAIDRDRVRSGEELSGTLDVGDDANVELVLVDDEGAVHSLSRNVKRTGRRFSFAIRLQASPGSSTPQLVVAIASSAPLPSLPSDARASDLFRSLGEEASRPASPVGIAVRYLKLGE